MRNLEQRYHIERPVSNKIDIGTSILRERHQDLVGKPPPATLYERLRQRRQEELAAADETSQPIVKPEPTVPEKKPPAVTRQTLFEDTFNKWDEE